jgi:hypothetical protein
MAYTTICCGFGGFVVTERLGEDRVTSEEALRQQYDRLSAWSQFYHDAEIRVNSTTLGISGLSALSGIFSGKISLPGMPWLVSSSVIGAIMILSSFAALISTLGYWRYYEFCDLYAKKFREEYIDPTTLKRVQKSTEKAFRREFLILRRPFFVNAHHWVWIVIQLIVFGLGATIFWRGWV